MTKAKPFNPIKPTTDPAWVYDENGQTIWMGDPKDGKKIADVRGWGWLQYTPDAEAKQDANGRLIAEAGLAHRASGKSPIELMELVITMAGLLESSLDAYGMICDTQGWDRHHLAHYTRGRDELARLTGVMQRVGKSA